MQILAPRPGKLGLGELPFFCGVGQQYIALQFVSGPLQALLTSTVYGLHQASSSCLWMQTFRITCAFQRPILLV